MLRASSVFLLILAAILKALVESEKYIILLMQTLCISLKEAVYFLQRGCPLSVAFVTVIECTIQKDYSLDT